MRVAVIALCPPTGAVADFVNQLVGAPRYDDVEVAFVGPDDVAPDHRDRVSVPYYAGRPLPNRTWLHAIRAVRRLQTDVALLMTQNPLALPLVLALPRHVPFAHWLHEPEFRGQVSRVKQVGYSVEAFLLRRRSDLAIVSCPDLAVSAQQHGLRTSVVQLPFLTPFEAVDTPSDAAGALVYFGTVATHKGLDDLAGALEVVASNGECPPLFVFGPGDLAAAAPNLADFARRRPELIRRVEGFLPAPTIAAAVRDARLVVLPYRSGTGTNTVPIAFRYETPVLATKVGCFPDLIADGVTGWLAKPSDPVSLAHSLTLALAVAGAERSEMQVAIGAMYRKRFTPEIVDAAVMTALRDLLRDAPQLQK